MALELSWPAKKQIINTLRNDGYATYATLVEKFDIFLTEDPEVVAYMQPGKAIIVINRNLSIDQVSTIVRHEILHEWFNHLKKSQEFEKAHPELKGNHQAVNIAGDFDISNRGYTARDKVIAKSILLGDKIVQGLVTELDEPGWEELTFEEMYQKLLERMQENEQQLKQQLKAFDDLTPEQIQEIEDMVDQIRDMLDQQEQDEKQQKGKSGKPSDEKNHDEEGKGSSDTEEKEDALDKVESEIDKIEDQAGKAKEQAEIDRQERKGPFVSDKATKRQVDLGKRLGEIKRMLEDAVAHEKAVSEVSRNKQKEKAAREIRDIERYQGSPLNKFKLNLGRFIADQIQEMEHETYARENPSYEDTEFIMPGKIVSDYTHIPVIHVYWDVSGSFTDPAKTEGARKAINTLNNYVRSGEIEIKTYYHANIVTDKREQAGYGNNGNNVMKHILATKPDNVIVITDSDLSDTSIPVTVPGAAWMLFYGSTSDGLIKNLHGKKETRHYLIPLE